MDYQMKYDHQWLCIIVNVSLVALRSDKKVGFTLWFSDFCSVVQKFVVKLFTSLFFSVKLLLSFYPLLSFVNPLPTPPPPVLPPPPYPTLPPITFLIFYGNQWMKDGMNEMVHAKEIDVFLTVGDTE